MSEFRLDGMSLESWLVPAGTIDSDIVSLDSLETSPEEPRTSSFSRAGSGAVLGPELSEASLDEIRSRMPGIGFALTRHRRSPWSSDSRTWWMFQVGNMGMHLMDSDKEHLLGRYRPRMWKRHRFLPGTLLRSLFTRVADLHVFGPERATRLDAAIDIALEGMPVGLEAAAGLPMVQRKGKLTVPLLAGDRLHRLLKIPLTEATKKDLEQAHDLLDHLRSGIPAGHPLDGIIPIVHQHVRVDDQSGWIEQALPGRPLSTVEDSSITREVLESVAEAIGQLSELPTPTTSRQGSMDRNRTLRMLIEGSSAEDAATLEYVIGLLERPRPDYLRKGDMSLNNILVKDGAVTGLIDWDESSTTIWPEAHLADFMLSWAWQKTGIPRAKAVRRLLTRPGADLPSGTDFGRLLEIAGMHEQGFEMGLIESCLDHAYHELKHTTVAPDRVDELVLNPLRAMRSHFDMLA